MSNSSLTVRYSLLFCGDGNLVITLLWLRAFQAYRVHIINYYILSRSSLCRLLVAMVCSRSGIRDPPYCNIIRQSATYAQQCTYGTAGPNYFIWLEVTVAL